MCTSFTLTSTKGDVIYGRTLEFTLQLHSVPIVFPKGVTRTGTGLAGQPGVGGLTWETTHAAVGMNGVGLEIILDGVNDAGLVAAAFNFPVSAQYVAITPEQESHAVACHEVGTYLLTTCANIAEVRVALADVPVHGPHMAAYGGQVPMVHYSIHDAEGNSIVLEWTNGELAIHDNPTTVLTNEPPFPMQIAHLAEYSYLSPDPAPAIELPGMKLQAPSSGGGMQAIPGGFLASNRFVRAFWAARCTPAFDTAKEGVQFARHILNGFDIPPGSVMTPAGQGESGGQAGWEMTEWSSMVDCTNRTYFVNQFAHQGWTKINLATVSASLTEVTTLSLPTEDRFHELTA
ncbi:MAG: linear amide C-N hydrolase [Actinobacteria bacterium]|nr:linear amide C-N hydrolase [Actinomycetota bacterium]